MRRMRRDESKTPRLVGRLASLGKEPTFLHVKSGAKLVVGCCQTR